METKDNPIDAFIDSAFPGQPVILITLKDEVVQLRRYGREAMNRVIAYGLLEAAKVLVTDKTLGAVHSKTDKAGE